MDSAKPNMKPGLEGVVVDTSSVSHVIPERSALVYRGYDVHELAEQCSFEEVAYLLWHEALPTSAQLREFTRTERSQRAIDASLAALISTFPADAHPMDTIRTCVSALGMRDRTAGNDDPRRNREIAMKLFAKIPTMVAADYRCRHGHTPIAPRDDLSFSENFFHMCFESVPGADMVRAFDVSMILYAEHGFNASTFTARVITSTLSDMYSAVCGAIGALKGPLHGGANEQVMYMLQAIGEPSRARQWLIDALAKKQKVMGFGHRVYKHGDSRVPTMKEHTRRLGIASGDTRWQEICDILEATMIEQKNIYPNLDFAAGPAYHLMGFDIDLFTPLFVMARVTGWTAHILEQMSANRLIRPLCQYVGPDAKTIVPLNERV